MLDIKLIRNDPKEIEKRLKTKDPEVNLESVLPLDERIRHLKTEVEQLKKERNSCSKEVGQAKGRGEDVTPILKQVEGIGDQISAMDHEITEKESELKAIVANLPNLPDPKVKASFNLDENVCLKTFGEKPTFSFTPKNHVELSDSLNLFDFKRGAKLSGSGFAAYRGMGARLEWALINYMIDTHVKNGFEQWITPLMGKPDILMGSGHLPKFEHQLYKIQDEDYQLYLIPTAEAVLNGLHCDEMIPADELPLKYVSYTPCFRREAGAAGAQERGLIRTHQFNKVELFCLTTPDHSERLLSEMIASAEAILESLGLHYRSMELVTGDMSFASSKTIDIEVWLPGQNRYYEVSSLSNCTDFQARRSNIRSKKGQEKAEFVHTLNGSGLATSRLLVGLLENNQQPDGSVVIPEVLRPYLGGETHLKLTPSQLG